MPQAIDGSEPSMKVHFESVSESLVNLIKKQNAVDIELPKIFGKRPRHYWWTTRKKYKIHIFLENLDIAENNLGWII